MRSDLYFIQNAFGLRLPFVGDANEAAAKTRIVAGILKAPAELILNGRTVVRATLGVEGSPL